MANTSSTRKRRTLQAVAALAGGASILTAVGVIAAGGLTVAATQTGVGGTAIGTCLADDSIVTVDPVFAGGDFTQFSSVRLTITSPTSPPTCAGGLATVNLGTSTRPLAYYISGSVAADGSITLVGDTRSWLTYNLAPVTTADWTSFSAEINGGTAQ